MSSVDPSNAARPLRMVGLVLLGVAALALVVGVVTISVGDSQPAAQPGPAASSTAGQQPPATTTKQPGTTQPSSATSPTVGTPGGTPSGTASGVPGTPGGQPQPGQNGGVPGGQTGAAQPTRSEVRVYNNSTVKGLAARAAEDFRTAGWTVSEVGNYPGGVVATTTVYFRPGTPEEASARDLAQRINARIEPRFAGIADASPGVIVIVTNNYQGTPAK